MLSFHLSTIDEHRCAGYADDGYAFGFYFGGYVGCWHYSRCLSRLDLYTLGLSFLLASQYCNKIILLLIVVLMVLLVAILKFVLVVLVLLVLLIVLVVVFVVVFIRGFVHRKAHSEGPIDCLMARLS